ncbi:hypothetical protein BGZ49_006135 [Haplosporangium sp. Z 27]|nr:hypothetical protein BGZ49_006135 [Haplosporangium sp. Z 27]
MTTHPSSGWRRSVGPQWSSVKRQGPGSGSPPGMQQGFHSSYLNALSRPDLDPNFIRRQQQHQLQQQEQLQSQDSDLSSATPSSINGTSNIVPLTDTQNEHQRAFLQYQENQRHQQLYLQQLQLMQRLQAMPGSTTRPWYPTFGPAITTTCSDSTIQLDNPNQFTLINNAKINRHAVGPHWRSIQTSAAYSPTHSPPSSSPLLQPHTVAPLTLSSRLSTASTTTTLHTYLSATYSSAASIDHARATSFHQQDQTFESMFENKDTRNQLLHQEYYQSHSYPHDPRHHLLQRSQPSNSREARENLLITNRALSTATKSAKRRANWQDEDDEIIVGEDGDNSHHETSSQNETCATTGQSTIQQFVPITVFTEQNTKVELRAHVNQDQEMSSAPYIQTTSITPSSLRNDIANMGQGDMEVVTESISTIDDQFINTSRPKQAKRTKQRLDWSVYGVQSAAETNRLQSGEQVKDIFQECFYNAASASR